MRIVEGEYLIHYETRTGDAAVYRNDKQFMHLCMDTNLKKAEVLRAFKELLIGINGVQ